MSFDVNPLNNNIPQLKANKTQDGGAGNTGYFEQKRKKQEDDERNKSVFNEDKGKDTFTLEDARELSYAEPPLLLKIVNYFKMIINSLFKK